MVKFELDIRAQANGVQVNRVSALVITALLHVAGTTPSSAAETVVVRTELLDAPKASVPSPGVEIAAMGTWAGQVPIPVLSQVPTEKYVATEEAWNTLWKLCRGSEPAPKIDFANTLVLIAFNSDPNKIRITPSIDGSGNLTMEYLHTDRGYRNPKSAAYQFMAIRNDGIKLLDGKPFPFDRSSK